ncbi:IS256 family transposase [Leptothermofonsia sichuanensis E412]|uniref:IS256 family transposase n=1 Tax=Leptothermofonsia sichuanensis TaxID=2917832 RepID=UPI001CA78B17|nr:IS256 family transposase [Leptothermofonsia sichuanensis]QZZ19890.1 IS256 family transposase [Leptothermofonsia sichuanensis E412]
MSKDNLIAFQAGESSASFRDALTELVRNGARQIIAEVVEAELQEFLAQYKDLKDEQGRKAVVRNGYLPERTIVTGVGEVEIQVPKVRDRTHSGIKFNSSLLPPYLKRAQSVEEVLPWLYLKGISTGDFSEALASLLGAQAQGLSASTISRLKAKWLEEHQQWQKRSLAGKRYVYLWADGMYFNIRNENDRQCILVTIGVTDTGVKELLGLEAGFRESELSWKPLLLRLQDQGLKVAPELAVGDGALGFWKALAQGFPTTKPQRCWVHKTANVLNKLPKTQQPQAKSALHEIYLAATKDEANKAFDRFVKTYEAKYPKAVDCLVKDREALLAFYDFPAEHWVHLRTTNPIESTFATVRLRTDKTRGCVSQDSILSLVFKLVQSAQKRSRSVCVALRLRIRGFKRLAEVIEGVKFKDGIRVDQQPDLGTSQDAA